MFPAYRKPSLDEYYQCAYHELVGIRVRLVVHFHSANIPVVEHPVVCAKGQGSPSMTTTTT